MTLVSTSDKKYTSVFGWGILGYKTFGTYWAATTRDSSSPPQLHIFDDDFVYVARTNDYEYFSWQYNWYYADTFELRINRYKVNVDQIVSGGFVAFKDEADEWHVGIIQRINKPLTEKGKQSEVWTFVGQSYESIFQQRICMHGTTTGTGYHQLTGASAKNMWQFVYNEAYSPTNALRRYPALHMDNSSNVGNTITYASRFEKLSEVLEKHVRFDPSYSYYLDWNGYGDGSANRETFTFKIRTGRNKTNDVKLSPYFGNIVGYSYQYDTTNQRTLIYVGGSGTGSTRDISENWWDQPATAPSGRNRIEEFTDATDCATDAAQRARALELFTDMSANQSCTFQFSPYTSDYVFLNDFKVGDQITVQIDDVVTMVARLISATETYDNKGRKVELTVGKERPDLIKMIRKVNDQQQMRSLV